MKKHFELLFKHFCVANFNQTPGRIITECLEPRRLFAGTLSGQVFNDVNGNGYREFNEPGLANYTVRGSGGLTAVTDVAGTFKFVGVLNGSRFSATPSSQTGFVNTGPSSSTIVGQSNDHDFGDVFSFTQNSVIAGTVTVGSSVYPGLGGQLVYVDQNDNSHRDPTEPFTTSEGGTGSYQIGVPGTGLYRVRLDPSVDLSVVTPYANVTIESTPVKRFAQPLQVTTPSGPMVNVYQRRGNSSANVSRTHVAEGGILEFDATNTTNAAGTYQWDTDYAPGTAFSPNVNGNAISFTADSTFDGNSTIFLATRMLDQNGVAGPVHVTIVDIVNTSPIGTFTGTTTQVGQLASVSFGAVTDPSAADAASLTFSYDLNNDGVFDIVGSSSATADLPADLATVPGTYTVRGRIIDKDGGFTDYTTPVTVSPPPNGSIRALLFNDADGNGMPSVGESGLSGRTVFLDTDNDMVIDSGEPFLTTDDDGVATFSVSPGSYIVRQVLPATWKFTDRLAASLSVASGATTNVSFGSQVITAYDSGMSGTLFNDTNGNGLQDTGELALAGRTVFDDRNNNGLLDTGERSAVSSSSGVYFVGTYEPGTHTVRQVLPAGWDQTTPIAGTGYTVDVAAHINFSGRNFGSRPTPVPPTNITIEAETGIFSGGTAKGSANGGFTGTGYADYAGLNSAAQWTVSRTAAGSATISFRYANGGTTNRPLTVYVNGASVGTLPFAPTGGWSTWANVSVTANLIAGNNVISAVASTSNGGANVDSLTISGGTTPPPPPATGLVTGFLFDDTSKDGVYQANEPRSVGKTVFIDLDADGLLDANERRVTTDVNGEWSFNALPAGNYAIRPVLASGTTLSSTPINLALETGQAIGGLSIGTKTTAVPPPPTGTASIAGTVFNDNNNNAKYDAGDGIGKAVVVFLDTDNDGVLDSGEKSVTTDTNGKFTFTGLAAGTYRVRRVFAAGQTYSMPLANITLTAGQAKTGVLVGTKKV